MSLLPVGYISICAQNMYERTRYTLAFLSFCLCWVLAVAYGIYAVSCDLWWILWDLSLQGIVSLIVVCGLQWFQGVGLTAPRQVGS